QTFPSNPSGQGGFKIVLDKKLNIKKVYQFPYRIYTFYTLGASSILIINRNKYDLDPSDSQIMIRDKCGKLVKQLYKFNELINEDTDENIYARNERVSLYVDNDDFTTLM